MEQIHELVGVVEFAKMFSAKVPIGINKIYGLVKQPGFPSLKIGGKYYVMIDKVNEWMENQSLMEK